MKSSRVISILRLKRSQKEDADRGHEPNRRLDVDVRKKMFFGRQGAQTGNHESKSRVLPCKSHQEQPFRVSDLCQIPGSQTDMRETFAVLGMKLKLIEALLTLEQDIEHPVQSVLEILNPILHRINLFPLS